MPIDFSCPHCGRHTSVADQYAGQSGPCAGCGRTITIPWPASFGGAAPRSKSGPALWIILAVVAPFVLLFCGGILVALLLPAVQAAREAARRSQCTNNLKQIALALHNYHDVYKTFPPAYIADENGRPMHSWRVLILPFMEQQAIYQQYDFNEPWDGPNNSRLAGMMPSTYQCPSSPPRGTGTTSYVMPVGQNWFSDGPNGRAMHEFKDGTSNTLMVLEADGLGVNWMDPTDITDLALMNSAHPGGANAALTDGSVRFISQTIDPGVFGALATIDGGENVGDF